MPSNGLLASSRERQSARAARQTVGCAGSAGVAARDDRAQVVRTRTRAGHRRATPAPGHGPPETSPRQIKAEVGRRSAPERQARDQRVDGPLTAGDLRSRRRLGPIELQHLPRPIAGRLHRPHLARAHPRQALLDQVDRPRIAVVLRRISVTRGALNLRPLPQQTPAPAPTDPGSTPGARADDSAAPAPPPAARPCADRSPTASRLRAAKPHPRPML